MDVFAYPADDGHYVVDVCNGMDTVTQHLNRQEVINMAIELLFDVNATDEEIATWTTEHTVDHLESASRSSRDPASAI